MSCKINDLARQVLVDQKFPICYNSGTVNNQDLKMTTATYNALTEQERREVGMFGCTQAQMREAVEQSLTYRFSGAAMYVMSLLSDAQEMVAYGPNDSDTLANILEDQRQLMNRAKWILSTYCMKDRLSNSSIGASRG